MQGQGASLQAEWASATKNYEGQNKAPSHEKKKVHGAESKPYLTVRSILAMLTPKACSLRWIRPTQDFTRSANKSKFNPRTGDFSIKNGDVIFKHGEFASTNLDDIGFK